MPAAACDMKGRGELAGVPIAVIVRSEDAAQEFVLADTAGIGRSAENELVLDAPNVSRRHARLQRVDGSYELMDLGSANGTLVGGREIEPRTPIRISPGARFSVGPYEVEVLAAQSAMIQQQQASQVIGLSSAAGQETAVLAREPRIIISTSAGRMELPVRGSELYAGRAPGNDIVIDSEVVSRRHFVLRRRMGGFEIEDLGSRNGLRVGHDRVQKHFLQDGDVVDIGGEVEIQYLDRPPDLAPVGAPAGQRQDLPTTGEFIIGRARTCDVHLDHPTVSLRHARMITRDGVRLIEDLGSTNGTFVNAQRIYPGEVRRISEGDEVRVGPVMLTLGAGAGSIEHRDDSTHIALDAVALRQQVSERVNLLQEVSFVIKPQEFVAVVGGSGAGKSTLLGALSGLRPASDGTVLLNGTPLYENFPAFRSNLGYVPQDDILHKELPIQRALEYAAALRLPDDTTDEERDARVNEVMKTLGLEQRKDVPILRLSGGQRKRVSIGAELLTKPGLFFLDEATSGLDPGTETQLMRLLRQLADDGHTIVLITHATKNVKMCDQVAFLARGGYLAYYGPPEQALEYFGVTDFDGIYEKLDGESTPEEWGARYAHSSVWQEFVRDRLIGDGIPMQGMKPLVPASRPPPANLRPRRSSQFRQTIFLARRYFDIIRRDRAYLILAFLMAPLLGAVSFIAKRDILTYESGSAGEVFLPLFLSVLFPFILGSLTSVREIVKESAIYMRERTVSLGVVPYVTSKIIVALLFAIFQGLIIFGIMAAWRELPDATSTTYIQLYVTIVLAIMSGVLWGLFISAITPKEEQAMILSFVPIMLQVVFAGVVVPLKGMGIVGTILGAITSTNWSVKALATISGLSLDDCSETDLANCRLPGFGNPDIRPEERGSGFRTVNELSNMVDNEVVICWLGMLAIMAVLTVMIIVLQKRKDTL
jgi:ABC-type multidrug transport system ATPase subunit/pSer/pThr/pTyr-binding forkhead associated (FHA) protein